MNYFNYIKEINDSQSKNTSKKPDIKALAFLLPYIKLNSPKILLSLLLMLVVAIIALPAPYLIKYIIDSLLPQKDIFHISYIIALIVALYLIKVILSLTISYLFSLISNNIQVQLRKDIFHKIISLPLSFSNKTQSGYLVARLNETQGLNVLFSSNILGLVIDILEMLFISTILLTMNVKMTLITICFIPIYMIIYKKFSLGLISSSRSKYETTAKLSEKIQESFSGISTVKSFSSEKRETAKITEYLNGFYKASITQNILVSIATELVFLVSSVVSLIILWFSIYEIIGGRFTIGMYFAFSAYSIKLLLPIQKLAAVSVNIQPAMAALIRIIDIKERISETDDKRRNKDIQSLKGKIEFQNVSFKYDEKANINALENINFQISPGSKIAIVGESGAGKTTLISLVLQLYSPTAGKILFDNIDSQDIIIPTLREKIGYVSQDIFLFEDTIKNNIIYGRPNADDSEIINASKESGAFEFINKLSNGFNTIIGERGINLSLGQKQKLSIARALLLNPDMFIFDEATSSLDSISQKEIQNFIKNTNNKTVIMIAHNIETVLLSDFVLVLKNGRLIEKGIPSELLKMESHFYNLFYNSKILAI
ncbi:MAG TPA: ABC transporter ATP-binding protein [Ignavibacteriaceae bacterium]|nr:ABC transporter ATP-binding protein [Ignavibacteriaceae bacterium]